MYRHLSLLRLAELIAHDSDREALRELHDHRTVFYYHSDRSLCLAEFVDKLQQGEGGWQWCGRNAETLDGAYDLTISKFSNLPLEYQAESDCHVKKEGPDCRYYFEAFIRHVAKKMDAETQDTEVEKEMRVAGLLQNFVIRHFRLSCLESRRTAYKLTRRYFWKVNGYTLPIWLPSNMGGNKCRAWLKANITEVDPQRPGERDRIQAVVDRFFTRRKLLSLDELDESEIVVPKQSSALPIDREMSVSGLVAVVAGEKAENIHLQRPAIRQLGKDKLRWLIHQIFDKLACGKYEAASIADSAGISRATFSRFAGSRWLTKSEKRQGIPVPDLWLNTAETLAGHYGFMRIARSAGVLDKIKEILEVGNTQRSKLDNE